MAKNSNQFENDGIDFKDAQNLTVGEAAQKESDLKAGITETDSVLDKYIKRHREEVASQKYDGETMELDTSSLDNFIKRQREELLNAGKKTEAAEVAEVTTATSEQLANLEMESETSLEDTLVIDQPSLIADNITIDDLNFDEQATAKFDPILPSDVEGVTGVSNDTISASIPTPENAEATVESAKNVLASTATTTETAADTIGVTPVDEPLFKNKKIIFASLAAVVLGIFAAGYYLNSTTNSSSTATSQSTVTSGSSSTTKSSDTSKTDYEAFEKLYATFFTDDEKTTLKNSEFSKLSELKTALNKLKDTDYYKDAKAKYDALEKQIKAVQSVNKLFDGDVIVDGELVDGVAANSNADFDSLTSASLSTGNASLDSLIQSAVSQGRSQVSEASQAEAQETATATASSAAAAAELLDAANPTTGAGSIAVGEIVTNDVAVESATNAATQIGGTNVGSGAGSAVYGTSSLSVSAATDYGITSYDVSTLQRHMSRVPYNEEAIADVNNPAWVFGEGILERILQTSRERGYISGNDYILERVNIINGNGYYNLFKPDGTYLFSINCKTGYFVGNGSGYSDALDY